MATLKRRTTEIARTLDRKCIIKEGYLIKSPPECDTKIIKKRWRMRWFVLYDTQPRVKIDPSVEREVELIYYKSEDKVKQGLPPKGKISLIGVGVHKHKGILHGYPHVIDVATDRRKYHLCTTQPVVHTEWLEKIRDHHVPRAEVLRRSINIRLSTPCLSSDEETRRTSLCSDDVITDMVPTKTENRYSNISITSADSAMDSRHYSITSSTSLTSVNTIDYDYTFNSMPHGMAPIPCSSDVSETCPMPIKAMTLGRWISHDKTDFKKPCPQPPGEGKQNRHRQDTSYITMKGYYKTGTVGESEDEGIGRTDSEASSISSSFSSTPSSYTSANDAWKHKRDSVLSGLISTRLPSTNSCRDSLLGGFVGPRLSSTTSTSSRNNQRMGRAKSLGDISLCGESTTTFEDVF